MLSRVGTLLDNIYGSCGGLGGSGGRLYEVDWVASRVCRIMLEK